ncbi:putative transcriptional regulatory protein YebC [Planctomycetales bacterium 10988]|nr:putative transcriptional regulatory protein YebC [Planctomycetales bacterium 10988]
MAGHSHWAGIKHKKAAADAKRGKLWSKLSKLIIVAARTGGGDPATNLRLRYAIDDARAVSMPKDNITRAIKKGTGELDGGNLEEVIYEGYGPSGTAVLCEVLTDNRNRTAPEIRKIFEMHGGNLGTTGCVAWMFDTRGLFLIPRDKVSENHLFETALEAGAEDVQKRGEHYEVVCETDVYEEVKASFEEEKFPLEVAEVTKIPQNTIELGAEDGQSVLSLMEKLDDHDDIQNVYSNYDIPDEVMEEIAAEEV